MTNRRIKLIMGNLPVCRAIVIDIATATETKTVVLHVPVDRKVAHE